jgi:signal transduction histidine kinase
VSRLTIRARLTVLYGGLLLAAGIVLLAVTYTLVGRRMPTAVRYLSTQSRGPDGDPSVALPDGDRVFLSELPEKMRDAALQDMLATGMVALVLVTAVAVAFGWLLAGRALQPLHRITETAHRIAAAPAADRGLHERIALAGPRDEVKELADTFDTMLERLDRSFDGQRRFVANASHELRTPLTLSRAVLEYATHRDALPPEARQLTDLLLDINLRHERLINGLLLLARTDNEMLDKIPVDLADVVEHTVTHLAPEADKAGVRVGGEPSPAPTLGDPVLLERLVQNLVENGIRHNIGSARSERGQHSPGAGGIRAEERSDEAGWRRPPGADSERSERGQHSPGAGGIRAEERSDEAGWRRPPGADSERSERGQHSPGAGGIRAEERSDEAGWRRPPGADSERSERGQHSPEGWVRVACRSLPDGVVELTVTNSGPVIPRYEIPGLFEPFRRYGTERVDRDRGAGLGLSIVRSVARAHGGEVSAEPRDGGGLLVRVTLPLEPDQVMA